jgi:hypothetical protein
MGEWHIFFVAVEIDIGQSDCVARQRADDV